MERHDKYLVAVVALASMALLAVSIATAQTTTTTPTKPMGPGEFGMRGGMGHMGMMHSLDPEEHNQIMKEHHPELTDEEIEEMFSEMGEHCPMMRGE